jgi:hypothetical protein
VRGFSHQPRPRRLREGSTIRIGSIISTMAKISSTDLDVFPVCLGGNVYEGELASVVEREGLSSANLHLTEAQLKKLSAASA